VPAQFQPKRANFRTLPADLQQDLRSSGRAEDTDKGYAKVVQSFVDFGKLYEKDFDPKTDDERLLWNELNLLGYFSKLTHEDKLMGRTLWGRYSALNSEFKMFGVGSICNVFPLVKEALRNYRKQDPEPESARSMESEDFDRMLKTTWSDDQIGNVRHIN
jgi:hypothetical protein